jgi:hypothetical protein
MSDSIKSVFDEECGSLVIDSNLVKQLQLYQTNFVNKNLDHIKFFGGNLTGVQVVRFMPNDRDRWFGEILKTDDGPLSEKLEALESINTEHHIASDTMNLSCVWLAHQIANAKKLTNEEKHSAQINIFLILQYKFLTSLLFRYFKYPADESVAAATYAQLSLKFSIKEYGSWQAVLVARSEDIIDKSSIHRLTIDTMLKDAKVTYLLSDAQGRVRDMLKNIYKVFDQVNKSGMRITTVSSVVEHDGVSVLKDKTKNISAYERYIHSVVSDKNSFIREELSRIIEKIMHTMPPRLFYMTLEWMSNNYRQQGAAEIERVITNTVVHCFDYLSQNRDVLKDTGDLPALLSRLRGAYMSSRSTDPALFALREDLEVIIRKATDTKSTSLIASVRTGVLLYICLRTLTMKHYSQVY